MGRLKSFRKKRRPGNKAMTTEEARRVRISKTGPCMACLVWFSKRHDGENLIVYGGEYNHTKSGNIRIGHGAGYCLCQWHHKRIPQQGTPQENMDHKMLTRVYGPSLLDGGRTFHETYGTDSELIDMQTEHNKTRVDDWGQQ